eukprot:GEZU01028363.1.p2 GENE.GEZU01028363.1~~GEZU01028363.1.p2  ORF type:complete len:114 (+),score=30.08 GEZU01028363.1:116-457(+)
MPKPRKDERLERHPGSGLPVMKLNYEKKAGGGGREGRGRWGRAGDEINYVEVLDENDPNFDPTDTEHPDSPHEFEPITDLGKKAITEKGPSTEEERKAYHDKFKTPRNLGTNA